MKKNLGKSKKSLVKVIMYNEMYNSEACWKGYYMILTVTLIKLDSENKKREALKENIRIRVKVF